MMLTFFPLAYFEDRWPPFSCIHHYPSPVRGQQTFSVARSLLGRGLQNAMSAVTVILDRATQGEAQAAQELLPLVYAELRKLAAARMADELGSHTLQPTALVHEAWLRLVGSEQQAWKNRAHFFAAAAEAMRRILIDRARRKQALKRGARAGHIDLDRVDAAVEADE